MTRAPTIQIAIVDPCSASGYTPTTLLMAGLGGTEATVLRIARGLAERTQIVHFQKGRDVAEMTDAGRMLPLSEAFRLSQNTTFVVINSWKVACKLRKSHPVARILLWLHINPGRHNRPMALALREANVGIVCVSQSHAERLRVFLDKDAPRDISHIHNPIADDLVPDATSRDPNRLLFASAPHKGLKQVFARFRDARSKIPDLTLVVADPGYLAWDTGPVPEGVIFLGTLSHDALIAEMRRALCLFYPQTSFAETFGLVIAEANAVGLPALVHRELGANAEVVHGSGQLVDAFDTGAIIDRLRRWRAVPPTVCGDPRFRLAAVVRRWTDLLRLDHATVTLASRVA